MGDVMQLTMAWIMVHFPQFDWKLMSQLYSIIIMLNMICFPMFEQAHCDVILRNILSLCNLLNFNFSLQVRDLVEKCTCPSQFPMIRVSEGKYRIGDTKVLIFVRVSIESSSQHVFSVLTKDHRKINRKKCYECNMHLIK